MTRSLMSLLLLLGLIGCSTEQMYGISEQDWRSYSPEKRDRISSDYRKIQRDKLLYKQSVSFHQSSKLWVKISGKAKMPPFASAFAFNPIEVNLKDGDCETLTLQEVSGANSATLKTCYNNHVLYLDPSLTNYSLREGSVSLQYSPIWKRGFKYDHVNSAGYTHLQEATIDVLDVS